MQTRPSSLLHVAFCAGLALCVAAALGYGAVQGPLQDAIARRLKLAEHVGRIMTLDEMLTMSARMAASARVPKWEERYRAHVDELDAHIKAAIALVDDARVAEAVRRTDQANARLVDMELRSFQLDHAGRYDEALALLDDDAYGDAKAAYAAGMSEAFRLMEMITAHRTEIAESHALALQVTAVLGLTLMLGAWGVGERRRRRQLADHADVLEETVRQRTRDLIAARDAAMDASRAKSQFIANMSHEIRTPMNGIVGMAEILVGLDLDEDARECAEILHHSGRSLLKVVDDVLDFSKLEAGRMPLRAEPFDLRDVVTGVAELCRPSAPAPVELVVRYPTDAPVRAVGDAARVRQVLSNIVGNAVKFTVEGRVVVAVGHDRDAFVIDVEDTGVGIPSDKLPTIFDEFVQADSSSTRRFGGLGLGLAISEGLVRRMNGSLSVRSRVGEGTTFTCRLPLPVETGATA